MPSAPAPHAAPAAGHSRAVDLADIFRAHGAAYRHTHPLSRAQRRAMRAIETCRTPALGGHRYICDTCGAERLAYNSCRNRHCPQCQTLAKARWLQARRAELLPVEYFHLVFTLPHALNALAQGNPWLIYTLLFHATADTLTTFGRDPRHLGGDLGFTAILHTWGQNLSQHLHLHCLVPGGALAPDGSRWIPAPPGFLFPVRAQVFRGKFLDALQRAFDTRKLLFAGSTAPLADPAAFAEWLAQLRQPDWVVYAKRPFAGPAQVLEYLGRYTHRGALSNDRILSLDHALVRFRWKDYADGVRPQGDGAGGGGVHPPLPAPHRPRRLRPHPPLRLPRQPQPHRQARPVPPGPGPARRPRRPPGRVRARPDAAPDRHRHRPLSRLPAGAPAPHGHPARGAPPRSPHADLGHLVSLPLAPPPLRAHLIPIWIRHSPSAPATPTPGHLPACGLPHARPRPATPPATPPGRPRPAMPPALNCLPRRARQG